MNDITALMATMKAAAEKATPGRIGDRIDGSGSIKYECRGYDSSLVLRTDHKNMEYGFVGDNGTADEEFFRACVPDNILALVEALEKAHLEISSANRMMKAQDQELITRRQRIASLESRTVTVKLPAMNDDLIAILGRPNFMCAHLAELLRKSGEDIKRKSEHEQAAVIHWFLGLYLEHGEKWESVAKSDIQRRAAGIQVIEGEGQ